jgi:hypothetical protein
MAVGSTVGWRLLFRQAASGLPGGLFVVGASPTVAIVSDATDQPGGLGLASGAVYYSTNGTVLSTVQ